MNEKPRVSSLGGKETSLLQEQSTLDLFSQAVLDSYVRELPNIGTDQRRRLTAFGAVISKKLKKSSSPSPSDLVGLRLRYPTGRKSAACGFFAKFLVASGLWTDKDLAEFEQLTGRRSVKITAFSLPFLDKEIRGQALQRIRQVLGLSAKISALILALTPGELRRIEKNDESFPDASKPGLHDLVQVAARLPKEAPTWFRKVDRFSRPSAILPFPVPTCPGCSSDLYVRGKGKTRPRGRYWFLHCRSCGGRYWSSDGTLHLVNPGRGWKKDIADRPICGKCNVACAITGSPGSSMKHHYFACPRCGQHYKLENGRAVVTTPYRGPIVVLPFLKDRTCPECRSSKLRIRLRPPRGRHFLFRCHVCRLSFRWSSQLKKLLLVKARGGGPKPKGGPGRPPGLEPETLLRAKRAAAFQVERSMWTKRKSASYLFPKEQDGDIAYVNTRVFYSKYKTVIDEIAQKLSSEEAKAIISEAQTERGTPVERIVA